MKDCKGPFYKQHFYALFRHFLSPQTYLNIFTFSHLLSRTEFLTNKFSLQTNCPMHIQCLGNLYNSTAGKLPHLLSPILSGERLFAFFLIMTVNMFVLCSMSMNIYWLWWCNYHPKQRLSLIQFSQVFQEKVHESLSCPCFLFLLTAGCDRKTFILGQNRFFSHQEEKLLSDHFFAAPLERDSLRLRVKSQFSALDWLWRCLLFLWRWSLPVRSSALWLLLWDKPTQILRAAKNA